MSLLSPSFTLVLILFLGAAIDSSPFFLRGFIDAQAPENNGMVDKSIYNPFPSVEAYDSKFGRNARSPYAPKQNWIKWSYISQPMEKLKNLPNPEFTNDGFNIGTIAKTSTMNRSTRSYFTSPTAGHWSPRAGSGKKLMVGGSGGLAGWFLRKSYGNKEDYSVAKDLVKNQKKSPANAGFGVSYGRG